MANPVTKGITLVTADGVPIDAAHLSGPRGLAVVVAHGFTQSWQRPWVWQIAQRMNRIAGVILFDFRGHGRSGGFSTLGDRETNDVDVAVGFARELGYQRVATLGFSMGASIVLRHAGLTGGVDAVVSVSGPGWWYYKGTRAMRRVHWAIEHRAGRLFSAHVLGTRISSGRWEVVPVPPSEAAALISPVPLLVVHGDRDIFFPVDHARTIFAAAREPKELWIEEGFGHAETAAEPALLDRIATWIEHAARPGPDGGAGDPEPPGAPGRSLTAAP
jgi:pimeloyl-ACP methyl ester carboxylesterase